MKQPFKALLLDERDVLLAVVELDDEASLTERHVDLRPLGGECDRTPGHYRWNRKDGCLEPLARQQRAKAGKPTLEQAFAFDLLKRWQGAKDLATSKAVELAWLDEMVFSIDFGGFLKTELVERYIAARGLTPKRKD